MVDGSIAIMKLILFSWEMNIRMINMSRFLVKFLRHPESDSTTTKLVRELGGIVTFLTY